MVGDDPRFDLGAHPAIYATDALHQAHGVPVQVIVDEPRGVLEVQAFGKDISRDQNANLFFAFGGEFGGVGFVVVGRKAADDIAALFLAAAAINPADAFELGFGQ